MVPLASLAPKTRNLVLLAPPGISERWGQRASTALPGRLGRKEAPSDGGGGEPID